MQQHPLSRLPAPVQAVADDGTIQAKFMGGMQPQLMGTARERDKLNPGSALLDAELEPPGYPEFSLIRVIYLIWSVVRIKSESQLYLTCIILNHPVKYGNVSFFHLSPGKLSGKVNMGRSGPRQHHQAGGVHIQPVDGGLINGIREILFNLLYHAFLLFRATSGNGQQAGRLINDNDVLINVE